MTKNVEVLTGLPIRVLEALEEGSGRWTIGYEVRERFILANSLDDDGLGHFRNDLEQLTTWPRDGSKHHRDCSTTEIAFGTFNMEG
ncbi:MAG: hypothetical protein WCK63_18390, partial [Betaproteobacteria bacterium]